MKNLIDWKYVTQRIAYRGLLMSVFVTAIFLTNASNSFGLTLRDWVNDADNTEGFTNLVLTSDSGTVPPREYIDVLRTPDYLIYSYAIGSTPHLGIFPLTGGPIPTIAEINLAAKVAADYPSIDLSNSGPSFRTDFGTNNLGHTIVYSVGEQGWTDGSGNGLIVGYNINTGTTNVLSIPGVFPTSIAVTSNSGFSYNSGALVPSSSNFVLAYQNDPGGIPGVINLITEDGATHLTNYATTSLNSTRALGVDFDQINGDLFASAVVTNGEQEFSKILYFANINSATAPETVILTADSTGSSDTTNSGAYTHLGFGDLVTLNIDGNPATWIASTTYKINATGNNGAGFVEGTSLIGPSNAFVTLGADFNIGTLPEDYPDSVYLSETVFGIHATYTAAEAVVPELPGGSAGFGMIMMAMGGMVMLLRRRTPAI